MAGKLSNHDALALTNILSAWSMTAMLKQFLCVIISVLLFTHFCQNIHYFIKTSYTCFKSQGGKTV